MKNSIILYFLFIFLKTFSQPTLLGAGYFPPFQGSGCFNAFVNLDSKGQMYLYGRTFGHVDFDLSNNISPALTEGFYICKYDVFGNLLWSKCLRTNGVVQAIKDITIDKNGDVTAFGYFDDPMFSNPATFTNLLSPILSDIFICRLDSMGKFKWSKSFGSTKGDYGFAMDSDPDGNLYLAGGIESAIDFDSGSDTAFIRPGQNQQAGYIVKLDTGGKLIWAKGIYATTGVGIRDLKVDAMQNISIAGNFIGTADFDPDAGVFNLTPDPGVYSAGFVARYSGNGNLIWVKQFGNLEASSLVLDKYSNVYTAGNFSTGDFDPGPGTLSLSSIGFQDAFINKLDGNGDMVWTKQIKGKKDDRLMSMDIDQDQNLYVTGSLMDTIDADPGPLSFLLSDGKNYSYSDFYVLRLSGNGQFECAGTVTGPRQKSAYDIKVDNIGRMYVAGTISDSTDFDPGTGQFIIDGDGQSAFLARYDCGLSFTSLNESTIEKDFRVFPVPSSGKINISNTKNVSKATVRIFDAHGRMLYREDFNNQSLLLDLEKLARGIYFLEFNSSELSFREKIVLTD